MNSNIQLLKNILQSPSVSGKEYLSLDIFEKYLCDIASIKRDSLGNRYAIFTTKKPVKILYEAHIDNVGYQVTYIDTNGFLFIRPVGGADLMASIGSKVVVETKDGSYINGVIGKKPIHLLLPEERKQMPSIEDVYVDCGLSVNEASCLIPIGGYVSYAPSIIELGNNLISAVGLDDKTGIYCLSEALRTIYKNNPGAPIAAMAAVQEEIGCRGAQIGVANIEPEIVLCVDVCFASDTPDMSPKKVGDIQLGAGPVLSYNADNHPDLLKLAEKLALENNIPFQKTAYLHASGGTDTSRMQIAQKGVKSLLISIPCRYMHTPVEVCSIRDLENTIHLLVLLSKESNYNIS